MRRGAWFELLAIGAMVAGCTTGHTETASVSEATVQGSIVIEPTLTVGSLEEEETSFGVINDVAIGPAARVFVADGQTRSVSVFAPDGSFLGRLMGDGEGPGEAASISDISVGNQDDLWVYDASLMRVTHLSFAGELRGTHPVRSGFHEPNVLAVAQDGRVFGRFLALRNAMLPTGRRSEWFDVGQLQAHLPAPPREPIGPDFNLVTPEGERLTPFNIEYLSDLGPDGCLYSIRSDSYQVTRTCEGVDRVIISRPDEPVLRVTGAESEEWQVIAEFLADFSRRMGDGDPNYPAIPGTKPFVRQLVVDSDGRIWLQRYTDPVPYPYAPGEAEERLDAGRAVLHNRSENRWDVYTPEGEFVGDIVLPQRARFFDARGDLIAGMRHGFDAIPRAVVWRMQSHPTLVRVAAVAAGLEDRD